MDQIRYERVGETLHRCVLPNGLSIYVDKKPGFQKSYAFFATNYGGMDMRFKLDGVWHDTPAGVAHYLEHKTFDTEDGNALQDLAANGASPNAFTSTSITGYYFESTEKFEENLRILLSFVSVPYYTQESVDKEQGIIGQEIRMGDDEPETQVFYGMLEGLYAHNPIQVNIAGTVESISHITAETLNLCHRAFYEPANMVLCVAAPRWSGTTARPSPPRRPRPSGRRRWRYLPPSSSWALRIRPLRRAGSGCAGTSRDSWPARRCWAIPAPFTPGPMPRG